MNVDHTTPGFRNPIPNPCDREGCTGHLGKFRSCEEEAIYLWSLDDGDLTGDPDFEGNYTLVKIDDPRGEFQLVDDVQVHIPFGYYVVEVATGGAVYVYRYDTDEQATEVWEKHDRRFVEWCGEDDDEIYPHPLF